MTDFLVGLVSNEGRDVIELVRNLVLDHIRGNTLILLTITMRGEGSLILIVPVVMSL